MYSFKFLVLFVTFLLLVLMPQVDAKWFKKEKTVQPGIENYEPPSETAEKDLCAPIEAKVVSLNHNTPRYLRFMVVPRREYLSAKLHRCKLKIMNQEFQYLKHVDIKNPSLESLPKEESVPQDEK